MSITAVSFSGEAPPRRIIATECEINIQSPADVATLAYIGEKALAAAGILHHGYFLGSKGGRGKLYPDVGHAEFAIDEELGPAAAAVADSDSIDIVTGIIAASGVAHGGVFRTAGTFIPDGLVAGKQGRFSHGQTSGTHENYLFPRFLENDPLIDALIPTILATRQYAMSGTLHKGGFVLSQKVWGCGGEPVTRKQERRTAHGSKPMLMIPPAKLDYDTVGPAEFARGEVRVAEPGTSLVARYAGFTAVSLGFRLVEQQRRLGYKRIAQLFDICLADPVQAAQDFAKDTRFEHKAMTRGGKLMTAAAIREEILAFERELAEKIKLPEDEVRGMDVIEYLHNALGESVPADLQYSREARARIDFAGRHLYIAKQVEPKVIAKEVDPSEITPANYTAMKRSLRYDQILPAGPAIAHRNAMAENDPLVAEIRELAARSGPAPRSLARAEMIDKSTGRVTSWATFKDKKDNSKSFGNPYGDLAA